MGRRRGVGARRVQPEESSSSLMRSTEEGSSSSCHDNDEGQAIDLSMSNRSRSRSMSGSTVDMSQIKMEIVESGEPFCDSPCLTQGRGSKGTGTTTTTRGRNKSRFEVPALKPLVMDVPSMSTSTPILKNEDEKLSPVPRGTKRQHSSPIRQDQEPGSVSGDDGGSAKSKKAGEVPSLSPIMTTNGNATDGVNGVARSPGQGHQHQGHDLEPQLDSTNMASSFPTQADQPLKTSTPIKRPPANYPTYSFFSLVTGEEEKEESYGRDKATSPKDKITDVILNTPLRLEPHQGQIVPYISPNSENIFLDREDRDAQFRTPDPTVRGGGVIGGGRRGGRASSISTPRGRPRMQIVGADGAAENRFIHSPLYVGVGLDSSSEVEDHEGQGGYRLRPRNLFNSGVSIKKYNMFGDDDSESEEEQEKSNQEGDSNVFFFRESEEDESLEMEEVVETGVEKKRSSYSGIRGPKADAKALSLVTNCPVSVKWLVDNFEYCPGRSLPRGFVYDQYVLLCNHNGLEPVNAASFGKLIRSVFPGLKTRRLGTRGNSKYHYNGVYLKPNSDLMVILNLIKTQQGLSYDGNGKRGRRVRRCFEGGPGRGGGAGNDFFRNREADDYMDCSPDEYLGKRPDFNQPFAQLEIDPAVIPPSLDESAVHLFESIYFAHCQVLMGHFEKFELKQVFDELKRFWRLKCSTPATGDGVIKYKDVMSKTTLFKVCALEATQRYIMSMDLSTYQFIMDILFPCLSKGMPVTMINGMRNFIKDVDFVFFKILDGYPKTMADVKLRCLRSFIAMWNDYTRLNRMLKSAVATIRNEDNLTAMYTELCRSINFHELESQIDLVKKGTESRVQDTLILEFRLKLCNDQNENEFYGGVKSWIRWAEQVALKIIDETLRQVGEGELTRAGDSFLIWKKVSDRILGAIVKGNAVSFGVFKGFLIWCDNLIKHVTKLCTARAEGFLYPIFYYEHNLDEGEVRSCDPLLYRPLMHQINQMVHEEPGPGGPGGVMFQQAGSGPTFAFQVEIGTVTSDQGQGQNSRPTSREGPTGEGVEPRYYVVKDGHGRDVCIDTAEMTNEEYQTLVNESISTTGVPPAPIDAIPDSLLKQQHQKIEKEVEEEEQNPDS